MREFGNSTETKYGDQLLIVKDVVPNITVPGIVPKFMPDTLTMDPGLAGLGYTARMTGEGGGTTASTK